MKLRTFLFAVSVVVLVASLIGLVDVFQFQSGSMVARIFGSGSVSTVQFVTSLMASFGYGGLFILMFLESASLPIPSEVILPFAGYLVYTGQMNFVVVLVVGTISGVAGALFDYFLALWLGRPLVLRLFRWVGLKPEHLDRAERWLDTKGAVSILLARFVPGLRAVISLPAGAVRMRMSTFLAMTTVGAFGWAVLMVYLGYSAGSLWETALSKSAPLLSEVLLIGFALVAASYVVYYLYTRKGPQSGA